MSLRILILILMLSCSVGLTQDFEFPENSSRADQKTDLPQNNVQQVDSPALSGEESVAESSLSLGAGDGFLSLEQGYDLSNPAAGIGSDFFGTTSDFSKGLVISNGDLAMKIGGYLKVDFIQDFDAIGSTDSFAVTTIEVDGPNRKNTRFHARQSRLNADTRWNSDVGPIRFFLEGDFFFNQNTAAELGTDRFRLRHAYLEYQNWTIGQTWTTFSDIAASPATLDFEGKVASIATRRAQVRWTQEFEGSNYSISLAIEDPFTTIEAPSNVAGNPRTETPDFVANVRWSGDIYQTQLSGVGRELGFQPTGQPVLTEQAWGVNHTQILKLSERSKFYSELVFGEGIASFLGSPDILPTGADTAEVAQSFGWMVGGTHQWTDQASSNVTYAENRYDKLPGLPAGTLNNTRYFAVNLIFSPNDRLDYGIEYLYGRRENVDGTGGNANRLQAAVVFYLD